MLRRLIEAFTPNKPPHWQSEHESSSPLTPEVRQQLQTNEAHFLQELLTLQEAEKSLPPLGAHVLQEAQAELTEPFFFLPPEISSVQMPSGSHILKNHRHIRPDILEDIPKLAEKMKTNNSTSLGKMEFVNELPPGENGKNPDATDLQPWEFFLSGQVLSASKNIELSVLVFSPSLSREELKRRYGDDFAFHVGTGTFTIKDNHYRVLKVTEDLSLYISYKENPSVPRRKKGNAPIKNPQAAIRGHLVPDPS